MSGFCSTGLKCIGANHIICFESVSLIWFIGCSFTKGAGVSLARLVQGFNDAEPLGLWVEQVRGTFLFFPLGKCSVGLAAEPAGLALLLEKAGFGMRQDLASPCLEIGSAHGKRRLDENPRKVSPRSGTNGQGQLAQEGMNMVIFTLYMVCRGLACFKDCHFIVCARAIFGDNALRFYSRGGVTMLLEQKVPSRAKNYPCKVGWRR